MDTFRIISVTILFVGIITWVFTAPCTENYCASVNCSVSIEQENCDLILENATTCGCCPICINYTREGEDCFPLHLNDIGRSGIHCGPQLTCEEKKCRRMVTPCITKLKAYENEADAGSFFIGKSKPHCDENGNFFRKQCRPGSLCYCVDFDGNRIFGETNDHSNDSIGCACSRKFHDMKRLLKNSSLGIWSESLNPMKNFFRCSANGDYDRLQCIDDDCFCINSTLHQDSHNTTLRMFRTLPCYNPNIHSEVFWRSCEQALSRTLKYIEKQTSENKIVIGLDIPECDLDGSYAPKQCTGNRCYCVNKEGDRLGSYSAERYSPEAKKMKCECARENVFLREHGLASKMDCTETGDYESTQCLRATCYCVDPHGNQVGKEFDKDSPEPCIQPTAGTVVT